LHQRGHLLRTANIPLDIIPLSASDVYIARTFMNHLLGYSRYQAPTRLHTHTRVPPLAPGGQCKFTITSG
jgi:hypothetical protein